MSKLIILGDEYDEDLKNRLLNYLRSINAKPLSTDFCLAGSQELIWLSVEIGEEIVVIECETFTGLSVSGPTDLVEKISAMVTL